MCVSVYIHIIYLHSVRPSLLSIWKSLSSSQIEALYPLDSISVSLYPVSGNHRSVFCLRQFIHNNLWSKGCSFHFNTESQRLRLSNLLRSDIPGERPAGCEFRPLSLQSRWLFCETILAGGCEMRSLLLVSGLSCGRPQY